ncbi:MAG: PfkB family carbohydrate kinase, partial [Solirubrobacterales bacterium]
MKTAVLGHIEWGEFALVERVPDPGDIVHARETFELPAGGAAVAAVQIARLGGNCIFMTAAGSDRRGDETIKGLEARGLRVEATRRDTDQRRVFVFLDDEGER